MRQSLTPQPNFHKLLLSLWTVLQDLLRS